jgi:hypothetical protein
MIDRIEMPWSRAAAATSQRGRTAYLELPIGIRTEQNSPDQPLRVRTCKIA